MATQATKRRFMSDFLELPQRSDKPRKFGLTMFMDNQGGSQVNSPAVQNYGDFIDIVKLPSQCMLVDEEQIRGNIGRYRDKGIDVQIGGVPFEVAKVQGKQNEYAARCRELGVNILEVESHALQLSILEMQREIANFKDQGFKVVGEVGAKWPIEDDTRVARDRIDVALTIAKMKALLEAGADYIYWEGMVVRALIGERLENLEGQKQLLAVTDAIPIERIDFEIWNARAGGYAGGNTKHWGWLIHKFGPEVNIGNCPLEGVATLEQMRRGVGFDPNHPYVRWLKDGKPTQNWWEVEMPDYEIDVQG